ncbi:hypothetical protein HAP94_21180 [Acidithiobacillus ferrivorans]|nr:hypothetical protein [Acidithiobacillus ferrivorans]
MKNALLFFIFMVMVGFLQAGQVGPAGPAFCLLPRVFPVDDLPPPAMEDDRACPTAMVAALADSIMRETNLRCASSNCYSVRRPSDTDDSARPPIAPSGR